MDYQIIDYGPVRMVGENIQGDGPGQFRMICRMCGTVLIESCCPVRRLTGFQKPNSGP
jgi:hypothetical protein